MTGTLNSAFAGDSIHVLVSPTFGNSRARSSAVTVQVWADAGDLTFTHQLNGLHRASVQVVVTAFGSSGLSIRQTTYNLTLQLTGDEYQQVLLHGWLGQAELPIRAPGAYQVRAAVRSGIVLYAEDSTPLDAGVARRIFAPGATLNYLYQILNLPDEPGRTPELETVLRLYRADREIFTGTPRILPAATPEDRTRRSVVGEMRLGSRLPAGHYWMQVTVSEKQPGKPRQAQQWIDFQVRP
jgi:hypothetical protein